MNEQRSLVNWLLPGKLAVGRFPRPGEAAVLAQANIKAVLTLCEPSEGEIPEEITQQFLWVRHILPDARTRIPLTVEQIATAVAIVSENIAAQRPVYVHCLAGQERSPTVCIAYLCRTYGMDLWQAIAAVRQVRPKALPSDDQLRVLREYLAQNS